MKLQNKATGREDKETAAHGRWYDDACGAAFAMELIGERWSLLVVRELMLGARRFSDIRASLPGISARVLTERLERLEALGVLRRRRLPPPAAAQVYELTPWGLELEDVMQALGRWAVRSPFHNPMLPLTPVAFMLSLRTMIDPARAGGMELRVGFEVGGARFSGTLRGGVLAIRRAGEGEEAPDLLFRAPSANDCLPVFFGKQPWDAPGMRLEVVGDPALARRFIDVFRLPGKLA